MRKTVKISALLLAFLIAASCLFSGCRSLSEKTSDYRTKLFSIQVPLTFYRDEDASLNTDDACYMFFYADPLHTDTHSFSIRVNKQSSSEFRSALKNQVDLKEYADGTLPLTSIGGFGFISFTQQNFLHNGDFTCYIYRDGNSGMTITISEGAGTPEFTDIISTVSFTLPDLGLSDPPYPWEQDAPVLDLAERTVGDFTIRARQIPFSERIMITGSSSGIVPFPHTAVHSAVSDDYLYTSDLHQLYCYQLEEEQLTLVKTLNISDESASPPQAVSDGVTVAQYLDTGNSLISFLIEEKDGTDLLELYGEVAISPDDGLLLGYGFRDFIIRRLTYDPSSGHVASEPFTFSGSPVDSSSFCNLVITENLIFAFERNPTNTGGHFIYVFDREGNYLMELLPPWGEFYYQTDFFEYDEYIIGRREFPTEFIIWKQDGSFLGSLSAEELLGIKEDPEEPPRGSMNLLRKNYDENGNIVSSEFLLLLSYYSEGVTEDLAFLITVSR